MYIMRNQLLPCCAFLLLLVIVLQYEHLSLTTKLELNCERHTNEPAVILHGQLQRQWNDISTMRENALHLLHGSIIYDDKQEDANYSIDYARYEWQSFGACFANKWVLFFGDSRLRYSYAEWIRMANNSVLTDIHYPRNSDCPYEYALQGAKEKCATWYKGVDCEYTDCVRDWYSAHLLSGRWTFNSLLTNLSFTRLITSSMQPDLVFYAAGAWNVYSFWNATANKLDHLTLDDYHRIIANISKQMQWINLHVKNRHTLKIWMAYPECNHTVNENTVHTQIINRGIKQYLSTHETKNNWMYFQLPTPSIPRFCEGFHVRNEWTFVENQIISNLLCSTLP